MCSIRLDFHFDTGLKEITWELPAYKQGAKEFKEWEKKMLEKLAKESQNP